MIWAILLASITAAPLVAISIIVTMIRAEARPMVIKREDCGFGGDWK
jgi:hypothetical protein